MTIWLKVMHCNWWDRYTRLHIIIVNHRLWVHYIISNATCSYNYCQILFTIITWLCVSVKHTVITFTYETLSLLAIVRCTQTNTNNLAKSILSSCLTAFSSGQTLLRKLIEISISRECYCYRLLEWLCSRCIPRLTSAECSAMTPARLT